MNDTLVINIVSGKGGTGKTLLAAVLADLLANNGMPTLVIDLDIFVRGLTALLYYSKREVLTLVDPEKLAVADYFPKQTAPHQGGTPGISRYRSFDVLPSVGRIDDILKLRDYLPVDSDVCKATVETILDSTRSNYKIIILDSRAGYDEFVSATHSVSDLSILVEEDDNISHVTSSNLKGQLEGESPKPLFRVTNKARTIKSEQDLTRETRGVTDLGMIPFDIDVMNSFGELSFWDDISHSLYKAALARVWNRLSGKLQLGHEIALPRISPVAFEPLERRIGFLSFTDRIFFVYGIILAVLGIGGGLISSGALLTIVKDPMHLVSFVAGISGLIIAGVALIRQLRRPRRN